jgi:hypothetical protein
MKNRIVILFILAVSLLVSCRKPNQSAHTVIQTSGVSDTTAGILVAENIIQDIVIKNNNPDNSWATECLKGMHREILVDSVFELVYSQRAIAYDFDTHEKITVKQLRQFEKKKDFSREKIGKIQFIESWYLNTDKVIFTKKVSSIVLGYETFDSEGVFVGYLPVFLVTMNP